MQHSSMFIQSGAFVHTHCNGIARHSWGYSYTPATVSCTMTHTFNKCNWIHFIIKLHHQTRPSNKITSLQRLQIFTKHIADVDNMQVSRLAAPYYNTFYFKMQSKNCSRHATFKAYLKIFCHILCFLYRAAAPLTSASFYVLVDLYFLSTQESSSDWCSIRIRRMKHRKEAILPCPL